LSRKRYVQKNDQNGGNDFETFHGLVPRAGIGGLKGGHISILLIRVVWNTAILAHSLQKRKPQPGDSACEAGKETI
ncbi:MAG: hypothetical protein PUD80_07425, partial [Firmicutes bacterium]|nr:hypothetical protein [Bacillota bacterium]